MSSSYLRNKKHSSKEVFFAVATCEGLRDISFQTEQQSLQYPLVCTSLLCISRREEVKNEVFYM